MPSTRRITSALSTDRRGATGTFNQCSLDEAISREISRSVGQGKEMALAIFNRWCRQRCDPMPLVCLKGQPLGWPVMLLVLDTRDGPYYRLSCTRRGYRDDQRLYIDHFKTFQNFEWKPGAVALLMGRNGAGKSMLFEVLYRLRHFICEDRPLVDVFPSSTCTRWDLRKEQKFEMDTDGPEGEFHYRLTVEHDPSRRQVRVAAESLHLGGMPLFTFDAGQIATLQGQRGAGTAFWRKLGQVRARGGGAGRRQQETDLVQAVAERLGRGSSEPRRGWAPAPSERTRTSRRIAPTSRAGTGPCGRSARTT